MSMARFLQNLRGALQLRGSVARDYEPKEACCLSPTHSFVSSNRNFREISFL